MIWGIGIVAWMLVPYAVLPFVCAAVVLYRQRDQADPMDRAHMICLYASELHHRVTAHHWFWKWVHSGKGCRCLRCRAARVLAVILPRLFWPWFALIAARTFARALDHGYDSKAAREGRRESNTVRR